MRRLDLRHHHGRQEQEPQPVDPLGAAEIAAAERDVLDVVHVEQHRRRVAGTAVIRFIDGRRWAR